MNNIDQNILNAINDWLSVIVETINIE